MSFTAKNHVKIPNPRPNFNQLYGFINWGFYVRNWKLKSSSFNIQTESAYLSIFKMEKIYTKLRAIGEL